jgi:L-alanine-DL-glutamate epimerase-like enolase superfamily enzyme
VAAEGTLSESQKRRAVDVVAAVVEAVGRDVAIAIETYGFLNGPTAIEMAHRLAALRFNCMWYEEPARPLIGAKNWTYSRISAAHAY